MTHPAANQDEPGTTAAPVRHVLIVGQGDQADRLRSMVRRFGLSCVVVPSYLAALGDLSIKKAQLLIGPAEAWTGSPEAIVRSARALCPDLRMIALCETSQDAGREALDAGFDQAIADPIDQHTLEQLLNVGPAAPRDHETAPQARTDSNDQNQELGDIDLADALLSPQGDVADIAVRMIQAHTQLPDVGLRPADGEAPGSHASVKVLYQGRSLGLLHAAPPADEEQLAPWAEWLGRWLALRDQTSELRDMALRDELTGAWNRRYFNRFLERILKKAARDRSQVTLLVFDIDDFKLYNDKHGHGTGDEVLREAARLMKSVVREHDVVARIGGDEFAVIFWDNDKPRKPNSEHPVDVVAAARRFQEAICSHRFPRLMDKAIGRLTVSGGLASFPWDGRTPQELLTRADAMALQSKRQGKNAICFGTGAKRGGE